MRGSYGGCIVFDDWIHVCVDADAKNRPIGNLSQWDDSLSDLEAAFRSWFIANDGRNELQKSGGSNSRKQVVQLSSRSISAGNLVFRLDKRDVCCRPTAYSRHPPAYTRTTSASVFQPPRRVGAGKAVFGFDSPSSLPSSVSTSWKAGCGGDDGVSGRGAPLPIGAIRHLLD